MSHVGVGFEGGVFQYSPRIGVSTVILRLLNRVNVSVLDLGGWLGKSRTVLLLTLIDDGPIRL